MNEIKRGMVFYAELNDDKGSVQSGCRPVVILQNDKGNKSSPTVIVAPVTSKHKPYLLPTHVEVLLHKPSIILTESIQTINKFQLKKYVGVLTDKTMRLVDNAVAISLGLGKQKDIEIAR